MISLRQILADFVFPEGAERRNRAEREMNMDVLTQLPNARALTLATPEAEADEKLLFIFFDGDNFGQINKRLSDRQGDDTLIQMARAIQHVCDYYGGAARPFRKGGDEFVVIAHKLWAEKIRNACERVFGCIPIAPDCVVSLTGGIGINLFEANLDMKQRKEQRKCHNRTLY